MVFIISRILTSLSHWRVFYRPLPQWQRNPSMYYTTLIWTLRASLEKAKVTVMFLLFAGLDSILVRVWEKSPCIACAGLGLLMKEAILAQGYIRWKTMSSIDIAIYPERRLWRHMSESRMSNYPRAIRLWQSVCSFVTGLLMFRQETTSTRLAPKTRRKLAFRRGTLHKILCRRTNSACSAIVRSNPYI